MRLSVVLIALFFILVMNAFAEEKKAEDKIIWNKSTALIVDPGEENSILYLNGERVDKTPIRIDGLKPGKYLMRIENPWAQSFEEEIEVKEKEVNTFTPTLPYRPIYYEYKKATTWYTVLKYGSVGSFGLSAIAFGASYYLKEKAYDDMVASRFLLSQEAMDKALKDANNLVTYSNTSKVASAALLALGTIGTGFTIFEYFNVKKIRAEARLSFVIPERALYLTYYSY